jgi:hypothetical protein
MEPKDKKSKDWVDWFIRHHFGGTTAARIEIASIEELQILQKLVAATIRHKSDGLKDKKR